MGGHRNQGAIGEDSTTSGGGRRDALTGGVAPRVKGGERGRRSGARRNAVAGWRGAGVWKSQPAVARKEGDRHLLVGEGAIRPGPNGGLKERRGEMS